jgi:molecular chaperone Hsp33
MSDQLVVALANHGQIRVYICETTTLVGQAQQQHRLWPTATAALGRVLSMGAMMGAMLKSAEEKITISINGNGPIGTILVNAYADGRLKGFVSNPEVHYTYNDTGKLAVGVAVGKDGYLEVIKDLGMKQNFTGRVDLQTGEIGDDFAYYFTFSEQTPSAVSVGVLVNDDHRVLAAGGLIIQLMPDANENDIITAEEALKRLQPISTMLNTGMTSKEILALAFDEIEILETRNVYLQCDCSRDRMLQALATIAQADLQEMIEENKPCELHCQFCNTYYHIQPEELRSLIK